MEGEGEERGPGKGRGRRSAFLLTSERWAGDARKSASTFSLDWQVIVCGALRTIETERSLDARAVV